MKKAVFFLLVLFLSGPLFAATRYKIKPRGLIFNSSGPTFVDNGVTYYYVIGGNYESIAWDESTNATVHVHGEFSITPIGYMPTITQFKNTARADAISKGYKAILDDKLSQEIARKAAPKSNFISSIGTPLDVDVEVPMD